jgi:1-acyl-sn-glycerol-3-phosphate acyltransferase
VFPAILIGGGYAIDRWTGASALSGARGIGLVVVIVAIAGLVSAISTYTRAARELPISALPASRLIQHGIYAVWRHPIYIFKVLLIFGVGLVLQSKGFVFCMAPAFTLGVGCYVLREERLLALRFGEEYGKYRRRTPLIVPTLPNMIRPLVFILFRTVFRWRIEGRENIPERTPFFVVASHRNYLDAFFIALCTTHPIRFIATYEMFRTPLLRRLFKGFLCIPKRRYLSDTGAVREVVRSLKMGYAVGVFPEGERSWTGDMAPFKPEAMRLLEHFPDVPIVPIRIEGNYHAWPRWGRGVRRAPVTLTVGRQISGGLPADLGSLEARIRTAVQPADHGVQCGSGDRAFNLERLLYRCPNCRSFGGLESGKNGRLICRGCGRRYELTPDYLIGGFGEEGAGEKGMSLAEAYERIRITETDLDNRSDSGCGGPAVKLAPGELEIRGCSGVVISEETGAGMKPLMRGNLTLTSSRLVLGDGRQAIDIRLRDIRSATVESYCKLQIYRTADFPLIEIRFETGGALMWQDFVVVAVKREINRVPNRA